MMFGGGHGRGAAVEAAKPIQVSKTLRRLLGYFRPFWGLLLATAVLVLASTLLRLVGPYLTGVAVDQFIDPSNQPRPAWLEGFLAIARNDSRAGGLTVTMLLLLGSYLLNWATTAGEFYLMMVVGQRV
ncbi:MAG TPA: hypothetical protein VMY80_14475, partial [Anaerolineae bacterium]|nr:hypothetical protein [Anaerolineae bacterium]